MRSRIVITPRIQRRKDSLLVGGASFLDLKTNKAVCKLVSGSQA